MILRRTGWFTTDSASDVVKPDPDIEKEMKELELQIEKISTAFQYVQKLQQRAL